MTLRAPFPWFGGKSRAAHLVWAAFGDVPNYVEPFAGSLAVLLRRPHAPRVETVNDLDCYPANFWRAVTAAPEQVARWADWPVNEADLHARHRWLVAAKEFRKRMRADPEYFEPKVAGWWVWGLSQWIGSGWCAQPSWEAQAAGAKGLQDLRSNPEYERRPNLCPPMGVQGKGVRDNGKTCGIQTAEYAKRPMLDKPGRGVHQLRARGSATSEHEVRPDLSGFRGVTAPRNLAGATEWEGRSNAGRAGRGVHGARVRDLSIASTWEKRPALAQRGGRGVGRRSLSEQIPDLSGDSGDSGAAGRGVHARRARTAGLYRWMEDLQVRLRHVRVCCGDFERVLGPSVTEKIGLTGVLLDPPYGGGAGRDPSIYAEEDLGVAARAREWALKNGDNPKLRIALCGYEGEHEMPSSWQCVPWKAAGGYAAAAGNKANAARERIWFSPACLRVDVVRAEQRDLFPEPAHG